MDIRLIGTYEYEITIQNMFCNYKMTYSNHNMITSKGLAFLVDKWNDEGGNITQMILGTNSRTPSPDDTIETFNNPYIFNVDLHTDENTLVMSTINLSGEKMNNTREIGVIASTAKQFENEEDIADDTEEIPEFILVSRSVHPLISIPSTALININYKYTLTSINIEDC